MEKEEKLKKILDKHKVWFGFDNDKSFRCIQAMLEFGEECFNAGIEVGYANGSCRACWEDEDSNPKYKTFEDYLKSLEDGNTKE